MTLDSPLEWAMAGVPPARFFGGNTVRLLQGGDELFPAMRIAIDGAAREVWFATYIFHDDGASRAMADTLAAAARRGVQVRVVLDGFGSRSTLAQLREWWHGEPVQLEVFRPLERWWHWMQPNHLRRLHQKLCVVDETLAFVGGVNIIDDRKDLNLGWFEQPRLDFSVQVQGPLVLPVAQTVRTMWARARLGRGRGWRGELRALARSPKPLRETLTLLRSLRSGGDAEAGARAGPLPPVRGAFVVRDQLRQRRAIERSYIEAMRAARQRIDIACPYFYPGRAFRRTLRQAARRGVHVRLLLQGQIDYRFAAMAARVLYDEMRAHGVHIYEYTPAFLHAKVALVDDHWATVGSSNIDPLSLLLNLEANVVVDDVDFNAALAARLDAAFAASSEVTDALAAYGWRRWLQRGFVAWCATLYLRLAGVAGRY
jgi:cardiolipin synthase